MDGAREKLGEFSLKDIVLELEKPGRDPRDEFVAVQFREDLSELKDVKPGMICTGVVTNVTNFGAFVDIGVHQDGLVHISQLGNKFVTDPSQVVSPGDKVTVRVLEVNLEKSQMALTMRMDEKARQEPSGKKPNSAQEPKKLVVRYEGEAKKGPMIPPQRPSERPSERPAMRPAKPAQAFNNPFAGLASLKDNLKK